MGPLDVGELEHPVASVAERVPEGLQLGGELRPVHGPEVLGRLRDLVVAERPPGAVRSPGEVQHERVGVELGSCSRSSVCRFLGGVRRAAPALTGRGRR